MHLFLLLAACDDTGPASVDTASAWSAGYEKGWGEAQASIDTLQSAVDDLAERVSFIEDDSDATLSGRALVKGDGTVEYDGTIEDGTETWLSVEKTDPGRYTVTIAWDIRTSPLCVATIHQEGAYDIGASVYSSGGTVYVSTGTADGAPEDKSFVLSCYAEAE